MRAEAKAALWRYDAMAGLLDGISEAAAALAQRDRAAYGERYLPHGDERGSPVVSNVLRLRFLVEICGLTVDEAIMAIAEHDPIYTHEWTVTMRPPAEWGALLMKGGNIAEALLDMEIVKARAREFPPAATKIEEAIAAVRQMRFAPLYDGSEYLKDK